MAPKLPDLPPCGGDVRQDRGGRRRALALAIGLSVLATTTAADPLPRAMSLNVCTDQLAMLVAAPGQLVSVSFMADDPTLSFLHERAGGYPENHGLAEEVFLAEPEVVVTGTYSLHNTTELLRGLGFQVEEFSFAQTLDTIPEEIRRMGEILNRREKAGEIAEEFEAEREELSRNLCGKDPTLVAYEQNGVTLGAGTLADAAIRAAGFRNLAAERGLEGMAPLPLEELVAGQPDVIVLPKPLAGTPSLADTVSRHPAIAAMDGTRAGSFVPRGAWSCGGPWVLEAVKALRRLRDEIVSCDKPAG